MLSSKANIHIPFPRLSPLHFPTSPHSDLFLEEAAT
jgi:hypothetical protein